MCTLCNTRIYVYTCTHSYASRISVPDTYTYKHQNSYTLDKSTCLDVYTDTDTSLGVRICMRGGEKKIPWMYEGRWGNEVCAGSFSDPWNNAEIDLATLWILMNLSRRAPSEPHPDCSFLSTIGFFPFIGFQRDIFRRVARWSADYSSSRGISVFFYIDQIFLRLIYANGKLIYISRVVAVKSKSYIRNLCTNI